MPIFILLILFQTPWAHAELEPFRYLAHPLDASFNIANLLAGDAPRPMDDAKKDKWLFSVAPTYFTVEQAYQTNEGAGGGALVRSEDLNGYGLSLAAGFGLSDRSQAYALATYITMEGQMLGRIPGNAPTDQYRVEGQNTVTVMNVGLGYDLLDDDSRWRIPAFMGLFLKHYNTQMTNTPLANSTEPFSTIEGSGLLYGVSFGLQATRVFFEKLKIMPYTFVGFTPKGPEVTVRVTNSNGNQAFPIGTTVTDGLDSYPFPVAGLSIGWLPWGVEFSVSGPIISIYSDSVYEGLKMSKYSIIINIL